MKILKQNLSFRWTDEMKHRYTANKNVDFTKQSIKTSDKAQKRIEYKKQRRY